MKPLISVVIPHKNSFQTLKELINTIPDSPKVDVIVVDDKSTKKAQHEVGELAKKRNNVSVFFNESSESNAGIARNIGLKHIKGSWVFFADADDQFTANSFDTFYESIPEHSDSDVILFMCCSLRESGEVGDRADNLIHLIEKYPQNRNTILYEWLVPWGRLIKASVLKKNELRFDSCIASNDVMFSTRLAAVTRKISVIDKEVYCCFYRSGSLTSSLSEYKSLSRLKVLSDRNFFLYKNRIPIKKDIGIKYFFASKPIKISAYKIKIYWNWVLHFF